MNWDTILAEVKFRTSRSSGPGGQHVNKAETRVEAILDIGNSVGLDDDEKATLFKKLIASVRDDGSLLVVSQKFRSQHANKEDALEKLKAKLEKALLPARPRIRTKPSKASVEERLEEKKRKSELKGSRRKPLM